MNNSSYLIKKISKIKKNSSSTITSNGSNPRLNIRNTYDIDKKEKSLNSIEKSYSTKDINLNVKYIRLKKRYKYSTDWTGNVSGSKVFQNPIFLKTFKDEFYSGIRVNKVPNYCANKMAINHLIRKKRKEKIMDYDNFYNNVKATSSKYIFKNNSEYFPDNSSRNIIKIKPNLRKISHYNKSCDDIPFYNKNISSKNMYSTNDVNYDEKNITDNFFPDLITHNENKKIKESTIIEGEHITSENNKDYYNSVMMTLLPFISNSKKNNKTNEFYTKQNKTKDNKEIKLYNFQTQKMRFCLFEALDNKSKTSLSKFNELEK